MCNMKYIFNVQHDVLKQIYIGNICIILYIYH